MRARVRVSSVIALGLCWLAGAAVHAETAPSPDASARCPICRAANDQSAPYGQKAGTTLVRGATNTAFGWTEMLTRPTEEVKTGGNLLVGIGKGMNQAVRRTFFGIGELMTFWTPKGPNGYLTLNRDCPVCMGRERQ